MSLVAVPQRSRCLSYHSCKSCQKLPDPTGTLSSLLAPSAIKEANAALISIHKEEEAATRKVKHGLYHKLNEKNLFLTKFHGNRKFQKYPAVQYEKSSKELFVMCVCNVPFIELKLLLRAAWGGV